MDLNSNKIIQIYVIICLVLAAVIGVSAHFILQLDLTDDETSQTFFVFCFAVGAVILCSAWFILKRLGVDVHSPKNTFVMLLSGIVFFSIPIWLEPSMSILLKVGLVIVICVLAIGRFYSEEYYGKRVRGWLGIETKEDRREKEREEMAKKKVKGQGE
jgi:drug/metabolite transporter (DMT)-like permease